MKIERIENLIKECEALGALISPWELGFLESVQKQITRNYTLSSKQITVVHRVEAKIKKAQKGDPEWEAEWSEQKASYFKVAVEYYKSCPEQYHSQVVDWADENPQSIPPRSFYKKIVENKYAQKIITGVTSAPKYPAGASVMLRTNSRQGVSFQTWNKFANVLLFVIEPTNRAINPAAGCRIYTLLPSISHEIIEVEERWIKRWKQPKTLIKSEDYDDPPF